MKRITVGLPVTDLRQPQHADAIDVAIVIINGQEIFDHASHAGHIQITDVDFGHVEEMQFLQFRLAYVT